MRILILNGPNINMLGIREPEIYGSDTYDDLINKCEEYASAHGVELVCKQSNHEGELIDMIQEAYFDRFDGIVFNPGGYTHTSIAILDALKAVQIPTVEVHISAVDEREDFRKLSYVSMYAFETISGRGIDGYIDGIEEIMKETERLASEKI